MTILGTWPNSGHIGKTARKKAGLKKKKRLCTGDMLINGTSSHSCLNMPCSFMPCCLLAAILRPSQLTFPSAKPCLAFDPNLTLLPVFALYSRMCL